MMTPELKAVADKYKAGSCSLGVAQALADAYLADHDETPVDEDFLREQGFRINKYELHSGCTVMCVKMGLYSLRRYDRGDVEWALWHDDKGEGVPLDKHPTRGDVLRLLSVVGRGE